MTTPEPTPKRFAFHLVGDKTIEGEQFVTNFFNSLFDIKKLVLVKQSPKDKHLIKEVLIILNSQNNMEMLSAGCLQISDTKFASSEIPVDEAEQLIRQNKTKLYVGNIPRGVDNIKLWKHFARFGALDYTYIIKKPDRNSRGFGFIIYEERESFERAVKSKHYIDGQRLICKLFLNKSQLTKHGKTDPKNPETGSEAHEEGFFDQDTSLQVPESPFIQQTMLDCLDDDQTSVLPPQKCDGGLKSSGSLPGKNSTGSTDLSKKQESNVDHEELESGQFNDQSAGQLAFEYAVQDYPTSEQAFKAGGYYGIQTQGHYQQNWTNSFTQPGWSHYDQVYQTSMADQTCQVSGFGMKYPEIYYQDYPNDGYYSPHIQVQHYQQAGYGRTNASSSQHCRHSAKGVYQARQACQGPRAVGNRSALPVSHVPASSNPHRRMPLPAGYSAQPSHQRGAQTTPLSAAPVWPPAVRPTGYVVPAGAHW